MMGVAITARVVRSAAPGKEGARSVFRLATGQGLGEIARVRGRSDAEEKRVREIVPLAADARARHAHLSHARLPLVRVVRRGGRAVRLRELPRGALLRRRVPARALEACA
jgi:hypothetical protein